MRRACCASTLRSSIRPAAASRRAPRRWVISWKSTRWVGHAGRDLVGDVPGDRLALAVGVGREIDLAGALGGLLQLRERLGLALDGDVLGLEPVLDVHAELPRGQVADVADRGLHVVAGAEILADRLGLGGRLDDDERTSAPGRSRPGLRGLGLGLGAFGLLGRGLRSRCFLDRSLLLYGALFSSRHVPSVTAGVTEWSNSGGKKKVAPPSRCKAAHSKLFQDSYL